MNRIEKMNKIRNHCHLETSKRAFFYRDEFIVILEELLERDFYEFEMVMSMNEMIDTHLPKWEKQSTANNHPSLKNINYILWFLIENKGVDAQDVPPDIEEPSSDESIGLTDFMIQALNDKFSHNILSVSVCANDPKQFTITLK